MENYYTTVLNKNYMIFILGRVFFKDHSLKQFTIEA